MYSFFFKKVHYYVDILNRIFVYTCIVFTQIAVLSPILSTKRLSTITLVGTQLMSEGLKLNTSGIPLWIYHLYAPYNSTNKYFVPIFILCNKIHLYRRLAVWVKKIFWEECEEQTCKILVFVVFLLPRLLYLSATKGGNLCYDVDKYLHICYYYLCWTENHLFFSWKLTWFGEDLLFSNWKSRWKQNN